MSITQGQFDQLQEVNLKINQIPYEEIVGKNEPPDWWTDVPVPGESWVCRDYVLAKARALGDLGWSAASMTVVLCWTEPPTRGYHAVLAVDTGDGSPMILDSRYDKIYRMDNPPALYSWDKRQQADGTMFETIA